MDDCPICGADDALDFAPEEGVLYCVVCGTEFDLFTGEPVEPSRPISNVPTGGYL